MSNKIPLEFDDELGAFTWKGASLLDLHGTQEVMRELQTWHSLAGKYEFLIQTYQKLEKARHTLDAIGTDISAPTEAKLSKAIELLKDSFHQIDDGSLVGRLKMLRAIDAFLREAQT